MKDRLIVSCCFAPQNPEYYAQFADRLELSLGPNGCGADVHVFRKFWPPGSPSHQERTYAFKYWAVKWGFDQGYRYVLWLDAGTQAIASIQPIWDLTKRSGVALLRGADCLGKWISDYALDYFDVSREQAMQMTLFGGCCIGLDRENPKAAEFFKKWAEIERDPKLMTGFNRRLHDDHGVMRSLLLADTDSSVISKDPRVEGHRSDEACFSIIADKMGLETLSYTDWQKVCRTY